MKTELYVVCVLCTASLVSTVAADTGGVVYTRWGKTVCPDTYGTQLVYQGRAAGSSYNHIGGGSDILCLPDEPAYLMNFGAGVQGGSNIYGVEYGSTPGQPLGSAYQQNMPCVVCSGIKRKLLMIPAKDKCPTQWQREYYGYLVAPHATLNFRSSFVCVDNDPEFVDGQAGDTGLSCDVQHVEATCNGLSCPPYFAEKELACVVCTL